MYMWKAILLSLVGNILISSAVGDVILDTWEDRPNWLISSYCVYAISYNDSTYDDCRYNVLNDTEQNKGYWSHCNQNTVLCNMYYYVQSEVATSVQIRAYVVVASSRVEIEVSYNGKSMPVITKTFAVTQTGWTHPELHFDYDLTKGAQIKVLISMETYGGKSFTMIDKVQISTYDVIEPVCPPTGLVLRPHPNDCSKYYVCSDGEEYLSTCAVGLRFDSSLGHCNLAGEVMCDTPQCPPDDGVSFLPIFGTCQKYTICVDGKGKEFQCLPGSTFSPDKDNCVLDGCYECPYNNPICD